MNLMAPSPPIPFQLVKDSTIDAAVGSRMKTLTMSVGIPAISHRVSLSPRDSML